MTTPKSHVKADVLLLLVTLLSALGWIFSKEAVTSMPPLLFMGIRFVIAGFVLAAVQSRMVFSSTLLQIKLSAGVGALFALAMTFWIIGLKLSAHVGEAAFITSLCLVLVPIMALAFFKEKPPISTWFALPLAISGLALLSLKNGFHIERSQILLVLAATIIAIHFNVVTHVVAKVPAIRLTTISLFVCGCAMLIISFSLENWPHEINRMLWIWILSSAILSSSLRFLLQTYAQSLAPASHTAVIMMLEPVWATLLSSFWFGEQLNLMQFCGCGLIFSSLLVNRLKWIQLSIKEMLR